MVWREGIFKRIIERERVYIKITMIKVLEH